MLNKSWQIKITKIYNLIQKILLLVLIILFLLKKELNKYFLKIKKLNKIIIFENDQNFINNTIPPNLES